MKNKLIYLASPYLYRGPDTIIDGVTFAGFPRFRYVDAHAIQEKRYQSALDATAWLMNRGMVVYSPIVATHPIAVKYNLPKGSEYWMQFDEIILNKCDEMIILIIDGVFESNGVKQEFKINRENGKDTKLLIPDSLEEGEYFLNDMDWETRDCLEL